MFCLPKNLADPFLSKIRSGEIAPDKLMNMTSQERHAFFAKDMGEMNAKKVNALFESKLLLKNQQRGMVTWAKRVSGLSERARKDMVARIEQMTDVLQPKEQKAFLNDLANQKLGTTVTLAEASNIAEMAKATTTAKGKFNFETEVWESPQAGVDYGMARVALENYVDNLKGTNAPIKTKLKNRWQEAKTTWGEHKAKAVGDVFKDTLSITSDTAISLVASVDNSFIGRQGLNTLLTHPTVWGNAAKKSFPDIYYTLVKKHGGQAVRDALMADVYARPNFMNGKYTLAKLIPKFEEQFPTTLPERVPGLGRVFKASENAFVNTAIRMRINTFDLMQKIAKENGVDINNKVQVQEMGRLINAVTARGDLGKLGQGGAIRLVLWAPKMLKGNWDVLTAHTGGYGLKTKFARQQAVKNLVKIVGTTAAVAAIANALKPGTVELDPRSSDFMRIKVGNTRFDITGGKGSIVTLMARAITFQSKSTRTGKVTQLNSGKYGAKSVFDVGIDFLVNKTTPLTRVGIDVARGRDFEGREPTIKSSIYSLTTPIAIQNFVEMYYGPDPDGSAAALLGAIADVFGVNANTYDTSKKWGPRRGGKGTVLKKAN